MAQSNNLLDANSPLIQVIEAAIKTSLNPNPANVIEDVQLAMNLVQEVKDKLKDKHPSILDIFKALL